MQRGHHIVVAPLSFVRREDAERNQLPAKHLNSLLFTRHDDPVIAADDPLIAADDPLIAADDPLIVADDPVIAADDPLIVADDPLIVADDGVGEVAVPFSELADAGCEVTVLVMVGDDQVSEVSVPFTDPAARTARSECWPAARGRFQRGTSPIQRRPSPLQRGRSAVAASRPA